MTPEDKEFYISNIISETKAKELIYWKNRCKKELEDYEFEAMMIRKYFQCSFYQKCRRMNADQLSERLWELNTNRIPYNKIQVEECERKIYLNHQAREKLKTENMPFTAIDFKNTSLIQQELF